MVDKPEPAEHEDTAADLRNKLIKRLAVAGVLVAILLGVLAFFDYLASPPEAEDETVYSQPVPVAPKKPVSQPLTPASELPGPQPVAPVAAEVPAPPQPAAEPKIVPEARPETVAVPHQEVRPAVPAPIAAKPSPAASTAVPKPTPAAVPESTAAPSLSIRPEPLPTQLKPTARIVESRPTPVAAPSGASRLFAGFLLQAGVFASQQRAEELHAKLTLSGVPSTLETRVQVGPFNTRQEAEAAQIKLRELGVETVLVPPRSVKH